MLDNNVFEVPTTGDNLYPMPIPVLNSKNNIQLAGKRAPASAQGILFILQALSGTSVRLIRGCVTVVVWLINTVF